SDLLHWVSCCYCTMRCPAVVLVVASAALPCARGFLRPSVVAGRRTVGADPSGASGDITCSRRSHIGGAAAVVVGRRGLFMMAEGRLTDDDLDNISLDPSTLDESELQRVEGIRAIQSKMVEVDEKKLELRRAARKQKEASQVAGEGAAALKASAAGDDGMTAEERQRAEGLASIERSLAEVTAIQRQLGISMTLIKATISQRLSRTIPSFRFGVAMRCQRVCFWWKKIRCKRLLAFLGISMTVVFLGLFFCSWVGILEHMGCRSTHLFLIRSRKPTSRTSSGEGLEATR
ncbi:unnamed protein product, partial [Ectocarpus sp. 12 AP-2014]